MSIHERLWVKDLDTGEWLFPALAGGDNVTLDAGTGGSVIATDNDGTAEHQYVKVEFGADNTFTKVTSSVGLPVDVLDSASRDLGIATVDNGGTFAVQEDGDALTALQLIDDVVFTDDAAYTLGSSKGVMMMGFAGTQSVNANDAGAIAMETDGAVHIHDGGNTITVDGTVTANLSSTDNTVLDNIDTSTSSVATDASTIAGAVSGSEMQVDVVGALPAGTNAIGKLAANSGVDIGDVDVTSISAGSNLIGDVGLSGARTSGGTTFFNSIDLDETEEQIKGTAGQLYWLHVMNLSSSVKYLQVFNATAASVTVGTTAPDLVFPLSSQGDTNGAGFVLAVPNGIAFDTAITVAATTTPTGGTGAGTNEVIINAGYA